jgi:hypothetical protein
MCVLREEGVSASNLNPALAEKAEGQPQPRYV